MNDSDGPDIQIIVVAARTCSLVHSHIAHMPDDEQALARLRYIGGNLSMDIAFFATATKCVSIEQQGHWSSATQVAATTPGSLSLEAPDRMGR